jgi:nicotinamidase-related amidase
MQMSDARTAVLLIDFINEIVHPDGKLAAKGYSDFVLKHKVLEKTAVLIETCRKRNVPLIFVRVGFSVKYKEHPIGSPLFGKAKEFGALQLGTWATDFHDKVKPLEDELVLTKHRVSAFHATTLDLTLRAMGVRRLVVAGVATDLAVQSAVRDAHDRDYHTIIVSDCCGAATDQDHEIALRLLGKVAEITTSDKLDL